MLMLILLTQDLASAERIVGNPMALAVVLSMGFALMMFVWRSLVKHQQGCEDASKSVLDALAVHGETQRVHGAVLDRIEKAQEAQWVRINKQGEDIAGLKGGR